MNQIRRALCLSEAIGRKEERHSRPAAAVPVPLGIADIDGRDEMLPLLQQLQVLRLVQARIPEAQRAIDNARDAGSCADCLDIAKAAGGENIQPVSAGMVSVLSQSVPSTSKIKALSFIEPPESPLHSSQKRRIKPD